MRVKWLQTMELILLEHISIYQHHSSTNSTDHASFISTLILNFLKIFIIRSSNDQEDELAFHQFGLTFYLRYFLLDLPTFEHGTTIDQNSCSECDEYSQLLRTLFDLLFDLIEYDLCEIFTRDHLRSTLIEQDYFHQFHSCHSSPFYRIRLLIYLIELISLHRYQCPRIKEEFFLQENQFFHWMEDFLLSSPVPERLSVCFNVIDLCLLFVKDRTTRVEQVSVDRKGNDRLNVRVDLDISSETLRRKSGIFLHVFIRSKSLR